MGSIEAMVQRLDSLALPMHEDRAALARLRRARKTEGRVEAYRYIMNYIDPSEQNIDDYVLVAALFGYDPNATNERFRNMGTVCRELAADPIDEASERRFLALLQANRARLEVELFRIATMAGRAHIAINYVQLFWDIRQWNDPERDVRKEWASKFYAAKRQSENAESKKEIDETAKEED